MTTKIAIVNLMPTKLETEKQFLNIFKELPLNIEVQFIRTASHRCRNLNEDYLSTYYKTLPEIKNQQFQGMIITGAPVEHLAFEAVDYWNELKEIMNFSKTNVTTTFHICWGAQAGLHHHYGIPKTMLKKKLFGVFSHTVKKKKSKLFKGFDDEFYVPHSRHSTIDKAYIEKSPDLEILSESKESGIYIIASRDRQQFFVTGHSEYDQFTLKKEYERDKAKGLDTPIPNNYFLNDDPSKEPIVKWRAHSRLLFFNWIYEYVLK